MRKERVAIHIMADPEFAKEIREYANRHQWSMNKACQNLIRIGLDGEEKK